MRRNIAQVRVIGMVSRKIALSQATIMLFITGGKFLSFICLQGYIHGITLQKTII
jgi:hypothetical protein